MITLVQIKFSNGRSCQSGTSSPSDVKAINYQLLQTSVMLDQSINDIIIYTDITRSSGVIGELEFF